MRKSVLNFNNGQHLISCNHFYSDLKIEPITSTFSPPFAKIIKLKQSECESAVLACMISITILKRPVNICHSDNL